MKKICFGVLILSLQGLCAFENPFTDTLDLTCDRSLYSEQVLTCVGHVQLDSPTLKLSGDTLCWNDTSKVLFLDGNLAQVDYQQPYAPSKTAPCTLKAEHMAVTCDATRQPLSLEAQRQVSCNYQTEKMHFHAQGDRLKVNKAESSKALIYLDAPDNAFCHIAINPGLQAKVADVQIDMATSCAKAHKIQATLDLQLEEGRGQLTVQAERASWDGNLQQLILEGAMLLSLYKDKAASDQEPFCTLQAKERLICACSLTPCFICHKIQVDGPLKLTHSTLGTLIGSGTAIMDTAKNKVIARGKQQSTGEILPEHQMRFETTQGSIQADRMALDLHKKDSEEVNKGPKGYSLHAQGSVGIEAVQGQYALGSEMHYDTRTQCGELLGKPSERVLFWEPRYDMNLSACACHFTMRDPVTGKMQVQGKGDVRMTFFDMERKKLQTRFPAYESL